jgi:hypothetical protein
MTQRQEQEKEYFPKKYNPSIEEKIYNIWEDNGKFIPKEKGA